MIEKNENLQVLNLVQAMVGAISPNLRRVVLEVPSADAARVVFLLEHESAEDREEIRDMVFEFEALQDRATDVKVEILVDARPLDDLKLAGRVVYGRKE